MSFKLMFGPQTYCLHNAAAQSCRQFWKHLYCMPAFSVSCLPDLWSTGVLQGTSMCRAAASLETSANRA